MEIDESKFGVVRKPRSPTAVARARQGPAGSTAEGAV
jgi:hypothetical protein